MIVYNITVKIDPGIEQEWIEWQRGEHIPEIMATGLFSSFHFFRLLGQDDADGKTFVLQYFTSNMENYQTYLEKFAPALREKAIKKWKEGFIAFRTIMESVN